MGGHDWLEVVSDSERIEHEMRIIKASIHLLNIPFKESFGHSLKTRSCSDSIVVECTTETGIRGFGEGVARPYVTGETVETSVHQIRNDILPRVMHREIGEASSGGISRDSLSHISDMIRGKPGPSVIAWHAAEAGVELAVMDCLLKGQRLSLGTLLPARKTSVCYSGIISTSSMDGTIGLAQRCRKLAMKHVKMKVGKGNDRERVAAARDILGPTVSLRLDANGAFSRREAIQFIKSVRDFNIEVIEQPVKRANRADLAVVREASGIPIMADESMVTIDDARELIEDRACDYFNLRIAKCGGLCNTLAIADLARREGVKIQLGCMVGETAILSAAGRHLAACLPEARFVEGSYGTHLLTEDIARESLAFGFAGEGPLLTGQGLGVTVDERILGKYSTQILRVI